MIRKKAVMVEIDEETIASASRADSSHCMIADAIKKTLPHVSSVSVDLQTIRFSDREKGERYIYFTPALAQQNLIRFDQGVRVEPWTLSLGTRPAQILKIIAKKSAANKANRPTTASAKSLPKDDVVSIRGGTAPPLGLLAHAGSVGRHKGQRRVFGIRAAKGFNPTAEATAAEAMTTETLTG